MKAGIAPLGAVALGVLLLLLSWVWPSLVGGAGAHSEQDQQAFEQARTNLLEQMHSHEGGHQGGGSDAESAQQAAQRQFDAAAARRDAAFDKGKTTAVVMRWIGVAVVALGALAHFAMRSP